MPLYQAPTNVPKVTPDQARLAPTPNVDNTAGIAAGGMNQFADFLNNLHNQKVKDAMSKLAMQKSISDMEVAKYAPAKEQASTELLKAQATKAMQEATDAKNNADALNSFIAKKDAANVVPQDANTPISDSAIPVPYNVSKQQSSNIEDAINKDPILQRSLEANDFALHRKKMEPDEYNTANLKARKEVGKIHLMSEFQNQVDAQKPATKEEASNLLRSIPGAYTYLDKADRDSLLNDYEKQSDLEKAKVSESHTKALESIALSGQSQTAANQDRTAIREDKKWIQQQKENLGKDLEKGDYVKMVSSYKGVQDALDKVDLKANNNAAFKTLQGLASNNGENTAYMSVVMNTLARIPVASWIAPNNITDVRMKQAKDFLDKNPAAKAALKDPAFQKLSTNLFDLINTDLKRASGTAVSASELDRFMNKIGLSVWNGDPGQLKSAIAKYGSDINSQLADVYGRYDQQAISEFKKSGGKIPTLDNTPTAPTQAPVDNVDHSKLRETRKSPKNPMGLNL